MILLALFSARIIFVIKHAMQLAPSWAQAGVVPVKVQRFMLNAIQPVSYIVQYKYYLILLFLTSLPMNSIMQSHNHSPKNRIGTLPTSTSAMVLRNFKNPAMCGYHNEIISLKIYSFLRNFLFFTKIYIRWIVRITNLLLTLNRCWINEMWKL